MGCVAEAMPSGMLRFPSTPAWRLLAGPAKATPEAFWSPTCALDMSSAQVGLQNASGVAFAGPASSLQAGVDGNLSIPLGIASATQPMSVSVSVLGLSRYVIRVDYY